MHRAQMYNTILEVPSKQLTVSSFHPRIVLRRHCKTTRSLIMAHHQIFSQSAHDLILQFTHQIGERRPSDSQKISRMCVRSTRGAEDQQEARTGRPRSAET
ncbi:hypothetical protein BD626DRAFT_186215 [Schizophyllum amplum]|uniref:Uncharacterized protein n=1 Tax=Schizophyllum amplum TaxID=97359 RepID=A0A550C0J4_9AGAR|nr:hypothetical protein BD626DRAFT_186215 [Auriculariopsis ampla]